MKKTLKKTYTYKETVFRVSIITLIENVILSAAKAAAGIIAGSGAMVSDAVHSASDVLSTVVVMVGVKISAKKADTHHPYGHERLECVAAIVLSVMLLFTGCAVGIAALNTIIKSTQGELQPPGRLAVFAAIVSIIVKESMYWYTYLAAKKIDSPALKADAWHHRSDAFSSIGSLAGIVGARLGIPVLDPIAGLIICIVIIKTAIDIFKDSVCKMVDKACDCKTEENMKTVVLNQNGVLAIDSFATRMFSNRIYVDVEIKAEASLPLSEAHKIAQSVHLQIEQKFPKVKHCMVHVNPNAQKCCLTGSNSG